MSNKFDFIDAKSIEYAKNIIKNINNFENIDEIVYEIPKKEPLKMTGFNKNIQKTYINALNPPSFGPKQSNFPKKFDNAPIQKQKSAPTSQIKTNNTLNATKISPSTSEIKQNSTVSSISKPANSINNNESQNKTNINVKESSMTNSINKITIDTTNNQKIKTDKKSESIDSVLNPVSVVDTFDNNCDFNSINNFDNIININDVYDDLGKTFQDDLFDQYSRLDKSVNYDDIPKYSYLPKRKIRQLLLTKYGISDDECINDLYSKAFMNKWKEIDLEHWLLNPANIAILQSKYGVLKEQLPKEEVSSDSDNVQKEAIKLEENKNEQQNAVQPTKQEKQKENVEEKKMKSSQKHFKKYDASHNNEWRHKKYHNNHNHGNCCHPHYTQNDNYNHYNHDHNYHMYNHHINHPPHFFTQHQHSFGFSNNSIKDDMKSVLIEENYRKMQMDFQTEILKNHIDSKFNNLNNFNNMNNNNNFNPYFGNNGFNNNFNGYNNGFPYGFNNGFQSGYNNQVFQQPSYQQPHLNKQDQQMVLTSEKVDNSDFVLATELNQKFEEIFDLEREKIKSEITSDIDSLKEKFIENEKNIYASLDFIRQEIRDNENSLKINLADSIQDIRLEINESLIKYTKEIDKKQELFAQSINESNLKVSDVLVESLKQNFGTIAGEIELLKNKINSQTEEKSNEIKDFRSEISQQLNNITDDVSLLKNEIKTQLTYNENSLDNFKKDICDQIDVVSNDMKTSIANIYSEIDALSEFVYNKSEQDYVSYQIQETPETTIDQNQYVEQQEEIEEETFPSVEIVEEEKPIETKVETFDNEFGVIETIRTSDHNFEVPNYDNYAVKNYRNLDVVSQPKKEEPIVQQVVETPIYQDVQIIDTNTEIPTPHFQQEVKHEPKKVFDYRSFASKELENASFNYVSKEIENDDDLAQPEYDDVKLTKEDKDFYNQFLKSEVTTTNKIVSNFDETKATNILDIEKTVEPVKQVIVQKQDPSDDLKSKLSRIDEIIKNSISELNDIKEIVDEDDIKIEESIKLFERVK